MKTLRKMDLEELARTMSIIPESDLVNFSGGKGTTYTFANKAALTEFLKTSLISIGKEVTFVIYKNGTCAAYIDDSNTSTYSTITINGSQSQGYYFPEGGAGQVASWGHTHLVSGDPTPSEEDKKAKADLPGLPAFIYTNNSSYKEY